MGKESVLYMNGERLCNYLVLENLYNSDFHKHRSIFVCFMENMISAANKILNSKMCISHTLHVVAVLVIKHKDSVGIYY